MKSHTPVSRSIDLEEILADPTTHVLLCCGAGGVGKTTTSAALGLRAAKYGRKVVVLTIDPARRLAQALGIESLDNTPQPVALPEGFTGSLDAMMLDMRRTFDEIILRYSSPQQAEALLNDPFYQTVASSLSGTQEYMAMEKVGQLLEQNHWDLLVVDTPPSRSALDFLDTPRRLDSFMNSRLWKLLLGPSGGIGRLVAGILGLAMRALSTVLGSQMLADAAHFVQALDTTFQGFHQRAHNTYQLLKRPGTQFMVIASPQPETLQEASFFLHRLYDDHLPIGGVILNRTHPPRKVMRVNTARDSASILESKPEISHQVNAALLKIYADYETLADHESSLITQFMAENTTVRLHCVPVLDCDICDLESLDIIGDYLTAPANQMSLYT